MIPGERRNLRIKGPPGMDNGLTPRLTPITSHQV